MNTYPHLRSWRSCVVELCFENANQARINFQWIFFRIKQNNFHFFAKQKRYGTLDPRIVLRFLLLL